jgi:uncharacterized protein (DUF983 family)
MADNFVPPGQQRYTRACMVCSIVMTQAVSTHGPSTLVVQVVQIVLCLPFYRFT